MENENDIPRRDGFSNSKIQSPSSINLYRQCPRKYYYKHIEQVPEKANLQQIRGKIVHKVLEDIYDLHTDPIPEDSFLITLRVVLHEHFKNEWNANADKLAEAEVSENEITACYEETKIMINNFFQYISEKIRELVSQGISPKIAFQLIKPKREVLLKSPIHHVKGYVDAICEDNGKTMILDYKTSKRFEISEDYKLQLAIYSLLFEEAYHTPHEIGVLFLKHGRELRMNVDSRMIEWAKEECLKTHINTQSKDKKDYPKKPSYLCKWNDGRCPYYNLCYQNDYEYEKEMKH